MSASSRQHGVPVLADVLLVAAGQVVSAACGAWLVLHRQTTVAGAVAAAVGVAAVCAVATLVVVGWYRRITAVAVRRAVHDAVHDAVDAAVRNAVRDPLTGLPTRAALDRALQRADASGGPFTVALVDVDGLHDVNLAWGHAAGDQYLAAIAERLRLAVPADSCLVRQGGDELTIVAAGGDAAGLQARISAVLAAPGWVAGRQVPLRASVGVAVGGPTRAGEPAAVTSGDATYVLACADAAMYSAKHAGGGQVLLYRADRDGRPALDGTRPAVRRRDTRPHLPDTVARATGSPATG